MPTNKAQLSIDDLVHELRTKLTILKFAEDEQDKQEAMKQIDLLLDSVSVDENV